MARIDLFYPDIAGGDWDWLAEARSEFQDLATQYAVGFILVNNNTPFKGISSKCQPWRNDSFPRQFFILWRATPVDPDALLSWRNGLIEAAKSGTRFYQYRFFSVEADPSRFLSKIKARIEKWPGIRPEREGDAFSLETYVRFSAHKEYRHYDPGFLTICPDSKLDDVFEQLDEVRRVFANIIGPGVEERRSRIHKELKDLLSLDEVEDAKVTKFFRTLKTEIPLEDKRHILPRVLLLGESGTGKTLVARYLAWRLSSGGSDIHSRPFKRVPLPEYAQDLDRFEHDLYGYRAGAFTGARNAGSFGYLLQNMGGVIFFDEIGDASPLLQTKLLAFLDDYQVVPRGWDGEPIFCPMLIIAATNRPLDTWSAEDNVSESETKFRNDLYQRFNFIIKIPGLSERKDELPYILDAMLQNDAFNPGRKIRHVGARALDRLRGIDFTDRNFRLLERLLRSACLSASRQGRDYLTELDVRS